MINRFFYSASQGYMVINADDSGVIHMDLPADATEITERPGELYTWDGTQWVAPSQAEIDAAAAAAIRAERDLKLATEVDPIVMNSLRWNSMTAEQQQAWADYRTALLDIPQQAGFPHNVIWPTKP